MLAISAAYYDDFISVPPGGSGTVWGGNNSNTGHGVLVVTIDGTGGSDDVFMRVINGNYQIGTSRNFATGDLVTITHPGYTAPSVGPVNGTPGDGTFTIGTSISSSFSNSYVLQTVNPVFTATPVTPGTTGLFTSTFSTVLVRTSGLVSGTDTPTFEIIGASQNFTKSLLVDLNDDNGAPITGSSITIGAPVNVAESGLTIGPRGVIADDATPSGPGMPGASPAGLYPGGPQPEGTVLLRGESITVSSFGISVNAGQPIYMVSQLGDQSVLNSGGININGRVSTAGQFLAEVIGTGFNINAGGQVSSGAAGLAQSVVIDATDADVRIPGKVLAADQYYFMQASQQAAQVRTISTRSPLTGSQQGKITADELIVYLANENDDNPTPGVDGVVDLQTSTNTLRITSSTAATGSPLQNVITIVNDKSMVVDAVAASSEDISLSTTAGTIDLQAAIVTDGSFSLSSFASLTVDSSISSARNISLTSTTGGVTTVATIQTASVATGTGKVTITAKNDVQIDSLVNAEYEGVTITSQAGKIFSGTNLAVDPTSRVTSPSATLSAVTGINLGTAVGTVNAAVTGTGAISIDDNGAGGYAAFLTVNSATTAAGSVAIKSAQTVDVMSLVAGGTGDASITSTGGNVNLIGTVIADNNAVTLTAATFAADGTTILASGLITGSAAPIANEINWTANNVVGDAADVAITASSYIGLTQTFETTDTVADGDIFYFSGPTVSVPDGFTLGTAYYVINFTAGALPGDPNTFQLSLALNGVAEGGATDLAGPIGLEPGNTDLYRNIPVVSAYRLSSGDINFVADDSTTLKAIKTTRGDVNVSSTGGSIVATSVVAKDGGAYTGSVTLDAVGGGVTLSSVATTSLAGIVSVFAAQGIADDGNAATTGITANTVNLSAGTGGVASDIGSAASRVTVAGVATGTLVALTVAKAPTAEYAAAIDASSVYIGASSGLTLNAAAVNLVDVKATGAATDVGVLTMTLSDADGKAVVSAGRDLNVGNIQVAGGAFGDQSSISLEAGGRLVNTNGVATATVLDAHALTLKASTFDGSFSVTNLDTFTRLTAAATAAGGAINLAFDRPDAVVLDGITTVGGNIMISNNDVGSMLVGSRGVTAGTTATANTITITSLGDIDGYSDPATTSGLGFGTFFAASTSTAAMASTTMSGWERVAPLGGRPTTTSLVSWQGASAAAYTDRWVVKASSPMVTTQSLRSGFQSRPATSTWSVTSLGEGYFSIVAPKATQASVLSWANATPGLAFAQPDFVIKTTAVPNDPRYGDGSLWGLNNTSNPAADIDAPAAWDISTGSRSTVVAVIDSGVDYTHPDLAANMWTNPGETPGDGIDNDGNGFVDDVYGWDFANNDADPMDDDGHGTHVAGTIGGVGNNGVGVVGVNWQVSIMAMKFLGAGGTGSISAAIGCVNYATMMRRDRGVNVAATNNSWGGGPFNQTLKDAIEAGGDAGILFVAAAGNGGFDFIGDNNDAFPTYPTSYDEPSIIAVAATDSSNNLASFSNYGVASVDVGAPGVGILSTLPGGGYGQMSGTSMATPHVAGIAALLASSYPTASASQIKTAILSSAVATPALAGKVATGGLVNAPAALTALGAIAGGGTISAGGLVTLSAVGNLTASTSARQLAATSGGTLEISQNGDVNIAGITAATSATLDAAGSVATVSGKLLTAPLATVTATGGISLNSNVTTLSAVSSGGDVTILETNGLNVGADGIQAAGTASITLTAGNLDSSGGVISGNALGIKLLSAGNLDVDTLAASLTASTNDGHITFRNYQSFGIGTAGIVAGGGKNVNLTTASGAITGGAGLIKAANATLVAATGIAVATTVDSVTATSTAGNIALAQTGKSVALTSLTAANGGVTVTNNDTITVTSVQAIGTGKNVSLTASGINKKIVFGANSITADGDSVTLLSTGGLDGTSDAAVADITAKSVTLRSSGGDVTATVKAGTVVAAALGTDTDSAAASKLDLTILGTSPVFVGTTSGLTVSAAGSVTLRTKDDPGGTDLPIVVVASPTAGGGVTYVTDKTVTFAVTSVAATGAGSLSQSLTDAGSATVSGGGTTGVGFSTAITSPIRLASTLPITKQTTLDGTQRLNLATGTTVAGRAIDIDGSQLAGANTVGFDLSATADNSVIRGFAFYGFNKANGVAVKLSPSANNVQIANNLFGISTGGQAVGNTVGISAAGTVGTPLNNLAITGNTVVRSTNAGILLGTNVTNATVTGNLIGTNSARLDLGNTGFGIDVSGAGAGNTIGGAGALANVVSNNGVGVRVTNTTGGTTVRGNEILLNTTGILVNGTSSNVIIAGNTVTRNKADGVVVNGTSSNVTVGGASAADGNYIGTTSTSSLGLGNAFNGVVVSSTGAGNVVRNNRILGNGTSNVVDNNAGVKLTGNTANGVTVTGNTITANRGAGILANRTGAGVATITANTIGSNFGSGVQVKSGTVVVGSAASEANAATIRANANTINSNARYGVEVLSGAFAQIAGNSMASNRLSGILNAALAAPTVTLATRNAANGTLTITVSGVTVGQVVHFYTGTAQGRTYLGRVAATGTTATLTMTLAEQITAGVSASVFVGAPVTATRTSTGANGQTSTFAATRSIVRA